MQSEAEIPKPAQTQPQNVEVIYKCACMKEQRTVNVPYRRVDEDMAYWVEEIMGFLIYVDHRLVSPTCDAREMEYVKIPVSENAPFVGGKPEVN